MTDNPYDTFYPVEYPDAFYGRQTLLQHIIRRLFRSVPPRSQQIIGLTRSGKTSLLNILACLNADDYYESFARQFGLEREQLSRTLFVQVNCAGLSTGEPALFWELLDQRLTLALQTQAQAIETQGLPCTTFECFSRKLFALKPHFVVIFLFDAFDRVARQAHIDITHNLRFLLEESRDYISYITSTSRTLYDYYKERPDARDTAPLFGYFDPEPIYLGLLEPEAARCFITEPARQRHITFTDDDIEFVLNKAGRHPDLTRRLCQYLFEHYQLQPGQKANYQALYKHLVKDFEPFYYVIMNELLPPQRHALLRLATQGNLRGVPERVRNELISLGLIVPKGGGHLVFSPVFEEFLSEAKSDETPSSAATAETSNQMAIKDIVPPAGLKVWEQQRAIQMGDRLESLTPNEWKLFTYLRNHANQVCTREELLYALSSSGPELTGAALDITISRLRQKIEDEPDKPRFIVTVRGRGYRFEDQETASTGQERTNERRLSD